MSRYLKLPPFGSRSESKSQLMALQPSTMVTPHLTLTMVLPNDQRLEVTIDRFTTLGDLKQMVAAALAVEMSTLNFHLRATKKRITSGLERLELADNELLFGRVKNRDTLHVRIDVRPSAHVQAQPLPYATMSCDQIPSTKPNETLESFGKVVFRGTTSQYDASGDGGESACTSICLVAAKHLLLMGADKDPIDSLNSDIVDTIVHFGVNKHRMSVAGHSCVDDLWTLPAFSDHVASLQRGPLITAQVGFDGFYKALERGWEYASTSPQDPGRGPRVAIVLTKSPETVLCFAYQYEEWYLFDSHGETNASKKVAYIMSFASTTALAFALQHKFPSLSGTENDNWQAQMYNSFEATPLVADPQKTRSDQLEAPAAYLKAEVIAEKHYPASSKRPFDADQKVASIPSFQPTESPPVQEALPTMPTKMNTDVFFDPIMNILMADPVVCDDGITYDRTVIEQHFQSRRDAEEARQQGTEEADASTTCCGGRRREIELTSPITGDVVTDRLVPIRMVEQQIVDLIESGGLDLSAEDLSEWQTRREEKRVKDRERAQEDRRIREEQAVMRRNREEARQRRAAEAEAAEEEIHVSSNEPPSQLVRVVNRSGQRLSSNDLGIAVSICDKSSWVSREYVLNASPENAVRCMVGCCAEVLDQQGLSWCERCGRIACSSCLGFRVTDYMEVQSTRLHHICAECLMQIVDMMPRDGTKGQIRALLVRVVLQPYMNAITKRAVAAQDSIARDDAEKEFGPGIKELENDVEDLQRMRDDLQTQIQEAKRRADQARTDDGTSAVPICDDSIDESVRKWEEACAALSAQYERLIQKNVSDDDEDAQFAHVQAVSDIGHRLEAAQTSLMEARSRAGAADGNWVEGTATSSDNGDTRATDMVHHESDERMSVAELQEVCATLHRQHESLLSQSIPKANEEAQMAHFLAISEIDLKFEKAQMQLAQARTRPFGTSMSGPNGDIAAHINDFFNLVKSSESPKNPALKKHGLFWRQKARPKPKNTSDSLHRRIHSMLLQARNYSRGDSLDERKRKLEQLQQALDDIETDIQPLQYGGIQTRYNSIMQEVRVMRQEVTDARIEQLQMKQAAQKLVVKPVSIMSLEELQAEHITLTTKLDTLVNVDEITLTMMRVTEIEHRLQEAEQDFLADGSSPKADEGPANVFREVSSKVDSGTNEERDNTSAIDPGLLDAIGKVDEEWPLPLGLKYPTTRMSSELELLQNVLEQNLPKSQQKFDDEYHNWRQELTEQKEQLEDEVARLRTEANNAEASATAASERLEERRERRRQEEAKRRERERVRLEQERKARDAEAALRRKHTEDENATRQALANAVGREGNAGAFGGQGDLRMCRQCKTGPVENMACSDLGAHNDNSNTYKGSTVARATNPNHCKHCGWFDSNWHNWPVWDGVFGPH